MTDYGARITSREINVMDKPWNDAREEIQRALNQLVQVADVVNIIIDESRISEGGGTTTVELPGGGDDDAMLLMGA